MKANEMKAKSTNWKKIGFIIGLVVDVALTVFLLIVSICMVAMLPSNGGLLPESAGMIGYLQNHLVLFGCVVVLPLFLLLVVNIIGTVYFVSKEKKQSAPVSQSKASSLDDLSEAQKEELKKMIIADLQSKSDDSSKEEK